MPYRPKALGVLAALALLVGSAAPALAQTPSLAQFETPDRVTPTSLAEVRSLQERIQDTVETVRPSVVGLRVGQAGGSGTLVTPDGYIATAGHVTVRVNAPTQVFLADGSAYQGRTLGLNPAPGGGADYSLVKIDNPPANLPYVNMGHTEKATVGQWIIAMGHPLGTETAPTYKEFRPPVVRIGRIHRIRTPGERNNRPWHIVVDAPLISGDSGGAMFDLDGNLIAINVSINPQQAVENNGTAISPVRKNWDRLVAGETVRGYDYPYADYTDLNSQGLDQLQSSRYERAKRVFLRMIEMLPGEWLGHYNLACTYSRWSQDVTGVHRSRMMRDALDHLRFAIDNGYTGRRNVQRIQEDSDLAPLRETFAFVSLLERMVGNDAYLGLSSADTEGGVRVESVGRDTAAEINGLRPGDLFVTFDGVDIDSTEELAAVAGETLPGDEVAVRVRRGDEVVSMDLTMGGRDNDGRGRLQPTSIQVRGRSANDLRIRLKGIDRGAHESVVTVIGNVGDNEDVVRASGVIVSAEGLVMTKASEVSTNVEALRIRLQDGTTEAARIVARDEVRDLAILAMENTSMMADLVPIRFNDADETTIGSFLMSVAATDMPVALGVRSLDEYQTTASAFLGIGLGDLSEERMEELGIEGGVLVSNVVAGTTADRAGLQENDIIVAIDGIDVLNRRGLLEVLGEREPGDEIEIQYIRGEERISQSAVLGARATVDRSGSAQFNAVRGPANNIDSGFGDVIQHDGILLPNQMGTLLVDLDGTIIGFNIARSDRTKTYAIPNEVLAEIVPALVEAAKEELSQP